MSLVNQLRWTDIIVILIVCRCIYIGIKRGLGVEIFKLLGTLLSVFTCLHYYTVLGAFLSRPKFIPPDIGNFLAFILIFSIFWSISFLIREMFLFLVKLQPIAAVDKWGGAFLGGIRGIFLSGIFLLIFIISPIPFLERGAKISYFGIHTFGTVAKTYTFMIEKMIKPFFHNENLNEEIFRAIEK